MLLLKQKKSLNQAQPIAPPGWAATAGAVAPATGSAQAPAALLAKLRNGVRYGRPDQRGKLQAREDQPSVRRLIEQGLRADSGRSAETTPYDGGSGCGPNGQEPSTQ